MAEKNGRGIDYIFPRYPLWIRYSGLPAKLGTGAWCVFQRLLELMERFGNSEFYYALERLAETTGILSKLGLRKILKRLESEKLIEYETQQGRGKKAKFKIILPIKTPVPEEEIYKNNPRLRPRSYTKNNEEKKGNAVTLLEEKKGNEVILLGGEKGNKITLLEERKGNSVTLFGNKVTLFDKMEGENNVVTEPKTEGQKKPHDKDNKKDMYLKRQQQEKDPFHEMEKKHEVGEVVVDINKLKEYGISGEDAKNFLKKYSQDYLREKIEIIEFKKSSGEEIRNIGGMLKKAIIGDWQPPPGFTTRAQRAQEARRKEEAEELAAREAEEKEERERMEHDRAKMAEEWKKGATQEELEEVAERARREILDENPGQNERWLAPMVRMREERIIAEKYAAGMHRVRRGH